MQKETHDGFESCSALIGVATFCFGHDPRFESDNHVALAGKHSASHMPPDMKTEFHTLVSPHEERPAACAHLSETSLA